MGRGETRAQKLKRKRNAEAESNGTSAKRQAVEIGLHAEVDTSKPTALFKPLNTGREWTVSVALPGSIIANAQSHDLRTAMAGHIARALSVFCVDEVIVFSDTDSQQPAPEPFPNEYTGTTDPDHFLFHLLVYLETPPNLRKLLFPLHPNLRTAGTLPSLDLPHHLRTDEWCPYREGVTLPAATDSGITLVEAGLRTPVKLGMPIPPNTRMTLKFAQSAQSTSQDFLSSDISAEAVSPAAPREEAGYYWGYTVRRAPSLSSVFTECPFDGGYDMSIGTSERGHALEDLYADLPEEKEKFKHILIVFGGVAGLEVAVKNDKELRKLGVKQAKEVFDKWINLCPGQGSRTIRTEEAVWIGLMGLRRLVESN